MPARVRRSTVKPPMMHSVKSSCFFMCCLSACFTLSLISPSLNPSPSIPLPQSLSLISPSLNPSPSIPLPQSLSLISPSLNPSPSIPLPPSWHPASTAASITSSMTSYSTSSWTASLSTATRDWSRPPRVSGTSTRRHVWLAHAFLSFSLFSPSLPFLSPPLLPPSLLLSFSPFLPPSLPPLPTSSPSLLHS